MLWFLIAVIVAIHMGIFNDDIVEFVAWLVVGVLVAFMVNIGIGLGWTGKDWKHYAVDGPVQTKVVNGEPSFVFRAGGQDWVLPTNATAVNVGTPELAVGHRSRPAPCWTVLELNPDSAFYTLTIRPS